MSVWMDGPGASQPALGPFFLAHWSQLRRPLLLRFERRDHAGRLP